MTSPHEQDGLFAPAVLAAPRRPGGAGDPERLLEDLNPQQREAVTHAGGPLLVVAGAGSGKTRVLTRRIAYLLAAGRAQPGEILAITFTNKAAGEMKERVGELVGPRARAMWVSTFHSACVRILRDQAGVVGLSRSFSIYDSADSQRLITLAARELDLDPKRHPARGLAVAVSNLKNELITPEQATVQASNDVERTAAAVYAIYQRRLGEANAQDFDDLIMTTVRLLQDHPDVADHYRRRFRHVLVDEYQDTNHAQYMLVRELVGTTAERGDEGLPPGELCVVGDADQSIYAFRGANIRNINDFESDYPDATVVLLEQNYRSTQTILSAANAIIAHNPDRLVKNLWSAAGAGSPIVGYVADNEHDEAAFVAQEVDRLTDAGDASPGQVAVFYRTNAQSRVFEEVFIRVGLPYKVVGGVRFYERREVRDLLSYLRVLANPADTVSLRRILNVPRRGIGDRTESFVEAYAQQERIGFAEALRRVDDVPGIATRSATAVRGFVALLEELEGLIAEGVGPSRILELIMTRTGYIAELEETVNAGAAAGGVEAEGRIENLQELVGVAREYEERVEGGDVAGFLEQVALVADADQIPDPEEGGGGVVTLMTLHSAKGLEFPVVFLTGLEDGVFPHLRTLGDPTELAEERRLAYVGVTRARHRLYLTRASSRSSWGQLAYNPASRFLEEVPDQLMDWRRLAQPAIAAAAQRALERAGGDASWGDGPVRQYGRVTTGPVPKRGGVGLRPIPALAVGDKVSHDTFGVGVVASVLGQADKAQAEVEFGGDVGRKRLLLRYAPLEKL
jgi:DNA helicase-2/ATP-dependent DNA helicase PcrA